MGDTKLLFFDVDGTIWDYRNFIPESTREAMRRLRKNGHKTFINTGRAYGHLRNPDLLGIGFDGIITGCGTCIQLGEEIIFAKYLSVDEIADALERAKSFGFRTILEGYDALYLDSEEWTGDYYYEKLCRDMEPERLLGITDHYKAWDKVHKFSCDMTGGDVQGGIEALSKDFQVIPHGERVLEAVPKGFGKSYGIGYLCEYYGIGVEDTFAFGDSSNDIDMLKHAGTGVVMGSAMDGVEKHADYVTTALLEDGIYKACEHFNLI